MERSDTRLIWKSGNYTKSILHSRPAVSILRHRDRSPGFERNLLSTIEHGMLKEPDHDIRMLRVFE